MSILEACTSLLPSLFMAVMGTCSHLVAYGVLGDFALGSGLCRVDVAHDTVYSTKCSLTYLKEMKC